MSQMVSFNRIETKCHLRALTVENPFLFVGMGSTLHILKTSTNGLNESILTQIIFKSFNINGINCLNCLEPNHLFSKQLESDSNIEIIVSIYGNRFLSIYRFLYNFNKQKSSLNALLECHNFHDWILLVQMTQKYVFIVKAHNEVVVFDYKTNQTMATISGTDKCILYSAELLLVSLSPIGFVLSSGTVFKEILIWSSFQTQTNSEFVSNSIQTLKGHDGVIFALNYNKQLNLLVSASDDRSVRIWTSNTIDSNNSIEFWNKNQFVLYHVFYGHLSRIWRVLSVSTPYPIVISVGEDSSLYLWNINDKKLIQRVDGHKNSSIWSLALDTHSMNAFSGGSDSCIITCDIINAITPFSSFTKQLFPKEVIFIGSQTLKIFCATIGGDLCVMSTTNSDAIPFRNSDYNHIFKTYSAIDVNEKRDKVLLGSKCGTIAIIDITSKLVNPYEIRIKTIQNGKIFSICFIDSFNFMFCGFGGEVKVWTLDTFTQTREHVLPNSRHRWAVVGLLHNQLLIVGDRCGSVFVYLDSNINPIQEFRCLHGSNGVTALKMKPKTNFLYSSGRNGKIFEFIVEDNKCSLLRIFRSFADMEWIGSFLFDANTNEMSYIYGFESRNFVVWDEREQRFVESIECGGGHRSWDFVVHQNQLYFCYTKNDNIICFNKQMSKIHSSNLSLTKTSHSKKINCCSHLFSNNCLLYFATAGEDNVIHINSLDNETNSSKVELYLFGHISNISAITAICLPNSSNSCFMVSVGGRSQLMVWKIESSDKKLICKQILKKFLWSSDNLQNRTKKMYDSCLLDPQIRYLDASITKIGEHIYMISTACSDSALRIFVFDSITSSFQLTNIMSFNTSCILKVLNIFDSHIITTSNDGTLKIWSLFANFTFDSLESNELNLNSVFEMQFHESGINALDVFPINENLWLIASGGDDNTLKLSLLKCSINSLTPTTSADEKYIHSSQITGIKILSNDTIVSAGIDQRVIVWKYKLDFECLSLKLEAIASCVSSIADISSFCSTFLPQQNIWQLIVCGEGFEVIRYSYN